MSVKMLQNYNRNFIDLNNFVKNQANIMSKCNLFIEKINSGIETSEDCDDIMEYLIWYSNRCKVMKKYFSSIKPNFSTHVHDILYIIYHSAETIRPSLEISINYIRKNYTYYKDKLILKRKFIDLLNFNKSIKEFTKEQKERIEKVKVMAKRGSKNEKLQAKKILLDKYNITE